MAVRTLRKHNFLSIIGILITIACASAAVLWETVGREAYLYKDVLVAAKDIKKGDIIDSSCLTYIKIEESKMISNPVVDPDEIITKAAKHFIPKNTQLTKDYFDDPVLVLNEDEFIFKVPNDWVVAVPSSIRRKDTVYFYEIPQKYISYDDTSESNTLNTMPYRITYDEWLNDLSQGIIDTKYDGRVQLPLFSCTVAYVKDSSNREVVNVGSTERFDGSAQISSIEIVITLKELRAMELSLEKGNKFIILNKEQ